MTRSGGRVQATTVDGMRAQAASSPQSSSTPGGAHGSSQRDFGGIRAGSAHGSSQRDFGGTQTAIARGVDPHAAKRKKPTKLG